jgi:hypothetical protein
MDRVSRFVVWICSKFNREQIERIVKDLQDILKNRNPEIKPKDDFKEKHPNYAKCKLQRASQAISQRTSKAS